MTATPLVSMAAAVAFVVSGCGAIDAATSDAPAESVPATSAAGTPGRDGDADRLGTSGEQSSNDAPAPDGDRNDSEDGSSEKSKPPVPTFLVSRVVDGDTLELGNGETVRLVGIDTPEHGECGFEQAKANLVRLVEGKRVRLADPVDNRDLYDRLLRYVNIGPKDAGLRLIKNGNAVARYDSRDGYDAHPREEVYVRVDEATPNRECRPPPSPTPTPAYTPEPEPEPEPAGPGPGWTNDSLTPGYTGCRQGYPGGRINGVYWWKPIPCS